MHNSYKSKKTFKIGKKIYTFFSLKSAEKNGIKNISSLPFSIKILLENLLRNENGKTVLSEDIKSFSKWKSDKKISRENQVIDSQFKFISGVILSGFLDIYKKKNKRENIKETHNNKNLIIFNIIKIYIKR